MDISYLLDGTSVAQEPQDEQTDPSRLLCSFSSFCLGLVFTRDVVIASHIALPVVAPHVPPVVARPHVNQRTPLLNRTDRKCLLGSAPGQSYFRHVPVFRPDLQRSSR
jgi:hypothetical protein